MPLIIRHSPVPKPATPVQRAFDRLIATIEEKRLPVYFLSPHLDDAVLSAGGLIAHLAKRTSVTIVTVFTEGSLPPYSPFARQCLGEAGYEDAQPYFRSRRTEDQRVCEALGVRSVHVGFIDAPWRTVGSRHVYQKRVKVTQINPKDISLIPQISEKILHIIKDHSRSMLFGPLAVGNHVDHLLVREVCRKTFPTVIYWSDFPYNATDTPDPAFLSSHQLQLALWADNQEEKAEGIKGYQTQIKSLFPTLKIVVPPDRYFISLPERVS